MKKIILLTAISLFLLSFSAPVYSSIIDGPDIGGQGTFIDEQTNLLWMDVDNYFGMSFNEVKASLIGTGFEIATYAQVQSLFISAGTRYSHIAGIMGDAPAYGDRVIMGVYYYENPVLTGGDTGVVGKGYLHSNNGDFDLMWLTVPYIDPDISFPLQGAFVVKSFSATTPEPTTMLLFGFGILGFVGVNRRNSAG
ncbi:MAG: PEP-CTERM sorting domain-containing protein [Desulfobacterales bacterium]|nr:PEP-CTERM sorting domain-containing protein [Desulfobacterales bacterium]